MPNTAPIRLPPLLLTPLSPHVSRPSCVLHAWGVLQSCLQLSCPSSKGEHCRMKEAREGEGEGHMDVASNNLGSATIFLYYMSVSWSYRHWFTVTELMGGSGLHTIEETWYLSWCARSSRSTTAKGLCVGAKIEEQVGTMAAVTSWTKGTLLKAKVSMKGGAKET